MRGGGGVRGGGLAAEWCVKSVGVPCVACVCVSGLEADGAEHGPMGGAASVVCGVCVCVRLLLN